MQPSTLSQHLISLPDAKARSRFLKLHADELDEALAWELKRQADIYLRTDVQKSADIAGILLQLAQYTGDARQRALGLLARANVMAVGLGEYEPSLSDYENAAHIYEDLGDRLNAARSQIGRVWALSSLSRYEEADAIAQTAVAVFVEMEEWELLTKMSINRAINLGRQGDDAGALAIFDEARRALMAMGESGKSYIPWIEQNRSVVLRNLGRLQESLTATEIALQGMEAHGAFVEAARARQSMAITYLLLGRYTSAITLMEEARTIFLEDGRQRDALLLDVFLCDCLLPLRRFQDVLEITQRVRPFFVQHGMEQEIGRALLDEAVAYAGLGRFDDARASLTEARQHFVTDANPVLIATADLELAALLLHLRELEQAAILLENAEQIFDQRRLTPQLAQTWLLRARIAMQQNRWQQAQQLAQQALHIAQKEQIIILAFRARHIIGQALERDNKKQQAMEHYEHAMRHLERMHGQLMTEFQADFLEDKTGVYEDATLLALTLGDDKKALELAERAKSRSLLSMIVNHIDLSLRPRSQEDEGIVAELTRLRRERDRILLRWETGEDARAGADARAAQRRVWSLEQKITKLWHQLLIHNADYANDAALWQVQVESPQAWLDEETLLLEFFVARNQLLLFLVDQKQVQAVRLPISAVAQLTKLLTLLSLNNRTLPWVPISRQNQLAHNARGLLHKLYRLLIHPVASRLNHYSRLIIIPHGNLHYLPFHALYDGQRYLIETHQISYLPASSLLRFSLRPRRHDGRIVAFGYSNHGLLPQAVAEANIVASIMGGEAWVEDEVTRQRVQAASAGAKLLHFATHGEFRADSPLFSGILLADGWLTALDIFNLRLQASLVTLSACNTGQHHIAGGDELLGLTRAFLYAGAASLLLSHWQIPDAIASEFITDFYQHLAAGAGKAAALRSAQLSLLRRGREDTDTAHYQHPFIWAPFFLIGAP